MITVPESIIARGFERTVDGISSFLPPTVMPTISRPYKYGVSGKVIIGVNLTDLEIPVDPKVRRPVLPEEGRQ